MFPLYYYLQISYAQYFYTITYELTRNMLRSCSKQDDTRAIWCNNTPAKLLPVLLILYITLRVSILIVQVTAAWCRIFVLLPAGKRRKNIYCRFNPPLMTVARCEPFCSQSPIVLERNKAALLLFSKHSTHTWVPTSPWAQQGNLIADTKCPYLEFNKCRWRKGGLWDASIFPYRLRPAVCDSIYSVAWKLILWIGLPSRQRAAWAFTMMTNKNIPERSHRASDSNCCKK